MGEELDLKTDTGAADHVIEVKAFPHDVIHVSEESRHGIHKAQVLHVHKPLKSVSRICDVGHKVMIESKGGCVRSPSMGEKIILKRENKVYRLKVLLSKSFSGEVWTCQAIQTPGRSAGRWRRPRRDF